MKKNEFVQKNLFGVCPFYTTQNLLLGKWILSILNELKDGVKRFNELKRIFDISHPVLTQQLKLLEHEGFIKREIFPEVPPRVEYSLTEIGKNFQPVLNLMANFGKSYNDLKNLGESPIYTTQNLLLGKWILPILNELNGGTKRFNELKRTFGISHSVLAKQLKFLENEGLINRKVYPEVPPRVEYSLTEIGKSFQPVLDSIEIWGKNFIEYLKGRDKVD